MSPISRTPPQDASNPPQPADARAFVEHLVKFFVASLLKRKPPQFNTGDATSFRRAVDMSDDELAAIVGRAKLTVIKTA